MPPPDADIHPTATGEAKHTVDAHQDQTPLVFYAGWFCPFVQRAWLLLEEKKIPYTYSEVNPYHKPDSLLKLNPRGLVPTLAYNDKPLYESNVICEFLEEAYSDHGPKFLPADVYDRARMRIWQDWVGSKFVAAFFGFLQMQGGPEKVEEKRKGFVGLLKEFVKEMDGEGPYFMGSEPTMVDLVIAPFALRLWLFDELKGGSGLPEEGKGGGDEEVWKRWRKWQKAMGERESVKKTTSDKEHYMPIYQRYADDKAQSQMAQETRAARDKS